MRNRALAIAAPLAAALAGAMLATPRAGEATYENARAVGHRCATCHASPHPGVADLNEAGRHFLVARRLPGEELPGLEQAPPGGAASGPPQAAAKPAASSSAPPVAPATAGAAVYERTCALCHGPDGSGTPSGKSLVDPLEHGSEPAQIEAVVRGGLEGTPMFAFESLLSDAEITAVVAHVTALRGR